MAGIIIGDMDIKNMKKVYLQGIGLLTIVLGLLSLSKQVYLLPLMQNLELLAKGSVLEPLTGYASQSNFCFAILLSVAVIVIGIVLLWKARSSPSERV